MKSREENRLFLQTWVLDLRVSAKRLENRISAVVPKKSAAENIAWLKENAPGVDEAVSHFARTLQWPDNLGESVCFWAFVRVIAACEIIEGLLSGALTNSAVIDEMGPDKPNFTEYMLTTAWEMFGEPHYLRGLQCAIRAAADTSDLVRWRQIVASELDNICGDPSDATIIQRTPRDRQKFRDFLSGENQLFGSGLDKRIKAFIANGTWGELSGNQSFYLILRLKLAGLMLDSMIRDEAPVLALVPKPPATNSASEFWRWLLITVWEAMGEDYLMSWVDDCLKKWVEQRQAPPLD